MADYTPSDKYLKHKAKRAEPEASRQANASQSSPTTSQEGATSSSNRAAHSSSKLSGQDFQAAIQLAKEYGVNINKQAPDPSMSGIEDGEVVLRDQRGAVIRKLPARLLPGLSEGTRYNKNRAIAWARSMGYGIPTKPNGCASALIIGLGFFIFVIPGILACIWVWLMNDSYEKKISAIIAKWVEAGRPEPGVQAKVEEDTTSPLKQQSTAEQLREYRALRDIGLVTDDEYQELRRKALGLDSD